MLILFLGCCTVWIWGVADVSKVHATSVIRVEVYRLGTYCDYIVLYFEKVTRKGLEWGLVPRLGTAHSIPPSLVPFKTELWSAQTMDQYTKTLVTKAACISETSATLPTTTRIVSFASVKV